MMQLSGKYIPEVLTFVDMIKAPPSFPNTAGGVLFYSVADRAIDGSRGNSVNQ